MRLIDADALKEAVSKHPLIDFTDDDIFELIDNAPTVFDDKAYSDGYTQGTCDCEHAHERPQGECEKCDYRKFTETFIDGIVDVISKNGIADFDEFAKRYRDSYLHQDSITKSDTQI